MTSKSSKAIPFIVLAIAGIFMGADFYYPQFEITEEMVSLAGIILAPLGLGGLVNKGWNVYKQVKTTGVKQA